MSPKMYLITLEQTTALSDILVAVKRLLDAAVPRPSIRLICDEPGSGFRWSQLLPAIKALAPMADIWICILDSSYLASVGKTVYVDRAKKVVDYYGPYKIVGVECGNEISGTWCGTFKSQSSKVEGAIQAVKRAGFKTAVTYYWDPDYQSRMYDFIKEYPMVSDHAWLSYYPANAQFETRELDGIFQMMKVLLPFCRLGFGEFGTEEFKPAAPTPESKALLVKRIHGYRTNLTEFVGVGGYWDFWQDLVSNGGLKEVWDAFLGWRW